MASLSAIDPTFAAAPLPFGSSGPNGTAVAVQPDGKVVEAITRFTFGDAGGGFRDYGTTTVYRLQADGSLDLSFGTNGQVVIPVPGGADGFIGEPHNLAIQADGSINLSSVVSVPIAGLPTSSEVGVVVQLTKDGQLDPGFGVNGETAFPSRINLAAAVASQAGNKVLVLAASPRNADDPLVISHNLILTRYNPNGTPDTSFNQTGTLVFSFSTRPGSSYTGVAVGVDPTTGRITVAGNGYGESVLIQFNNDGTLNTSFGTGGTVTLPPTIARGDAPSLGDLAIGSDGSILVAGATATDTFNPTRTINTGYLARIGPDGTVDATFAAAVARGTTLAGVSLNKVAVAPDGTITVAGNGSDALTNTIVVDRFLMTGAVDVGFGRFGRYVLPLTVNGSRLGTVASQSGLALTTTNDIIVSGLAYSQTHPLPEGNVNVLVRLLPVAVSPVSGDYDGDGISDLAVYLTTPGVHAHRPSAGASDVLAPIGDSGVGASIPAPGDYDGDGKADLAVYLPARGQLVYRPSSGGASDVTVAIGGGSSIPAPGDYDGDGITDAAVYEPDTGSFLIRDSSTGQTSTIQFGSAGAGASIPVPGDYDGDGRADIAVYLTQYAGFAVLPSGGSPAYFVQFGLPGLGATIPTPGDYDGDGKTDLAVFLPQSTVYAYRPSGAPAGTPDVLQGIGLPGPGATIPTPGDYDGDGKADLAVYVPQYALYAYRPSGSAVGVPDVWTTFGIVGDGQTVPVSSIPAALPPVVSASALATSSDDAGVPIAFGAADVEGLDGASLLASRKAKRS